MRQVKGGHSAHSQDDLVVHFGLGDATVIDELRIEWPFFDPNTQQSSVDVLLSVNVNQMRTVASHGSVPI